MTPNPNPSPECICGKRFTMCEDGHAIDCPASNQFAKWKEMATPAALSQTLPAPGEVEPMQTRIAWAIFRAATPDALRELRELGNASPIADAVIAALATQFDVREAIHNAKTKADKVHGIAWHNLEEVSRFELFLDALATQPAMSHEGNGSHPDDRAVDLFAARMKTKLAMAREKGRGGWDDPEQCSVAYLQQLLREHIVKGDPVDVANFCMMLSHYGATTTLATVAAANDEGVAEQAVDTTEYRTDYQIGKADGIEAAAKVADQQRASCNREADSRCLGPVRLQWRRAAEEVAMTAAAIRLWSQGGGK